MNKLMLVICVICLVSIKLFSQEEPVKIIGFKQGTTYSVTYYDKDNRNFKPEIEQLLHKFNKSVSLYDSTSIISRVNNNDKNVILDEYFRVCFNKSVEVSKATDGAFDATVGPLVSGWGFSFKKKERMDSAMVDSILHFIGYQLVEMRDGKVIKKDDRIKLDFNWRRSICQR
jgi:FAD:protein FMN transferase